jgi:hypothetical protein
MTGANKRRAGRFFPNEAFELKQIARRLKDFGLPGPTTARAVEQRIRWIADRIDGRAEASEGRPEADRS